MTQYDKTSPNAVAFRDQVRQIAIDTFDAADKLQRKMNYLASKITSGSHLIDGEREEIDELVSDLTAMSEMVARIEAKAGLVARRTKTSTTITILS